MAENKCNGCRYWYKQEETDIRGYCRRHAPKPATQSPLAESTNLDGVWPRTSGEDWCGEWAEL